VHHRPLDSRPRSLYNQSMSGMDVRRLARGLVRRSAEVFVELRHGVRTADHVYHEDLGLSTEDRVWHDASNWVATRRALDRLGVDRQDVFADFGSGLGRALLVASQLPFGRVIGVEVSAELTERARANLAGYRGRRRCGEVEFVTSDALDWPIPPDLTVAYFYCPFTGDVFDGVVRNLIASVDANPRPIRLVYNYPLEHNRLLATGRVRVLDVLGAAWPASGRPSEAIVIYQVLPGDDREARRLADRFPQRVRDSPWLGPYEPGFALEKPARLGGVALERPAQRDQ
jgi:hypothetical protein